MCPRILSFFRSFRYSSHSAEIYERFYLKLLFSKPLEALSEIFLKVPSEVSSVILRGFLQGFHLGFLQEFREPFSFQGFPYSLYWNIFTFFFRGFTEGIHGKMEFLRNYWRKPRKNSRGIPDKADEGLRNVGEILQETPA